MLVWLSLNAEQLIRTDFNEKLESTKCIVMAIKLSLLRDVQQSVVKQTCSASFNTISFISLVHFSYRAWICSLEIEWRFGSV